MLGALPRNQDQIEIGRQSRAGMPEGLAQESFDFVAAHGGTVFFADRYTEPRARRVIAPQSYDRHPCSGGTHAALVNAAEIAV
ncbi:hypothetical protein LBMAG49_13800 [Planctomycetota bacterium]|nr:hypothetical protein LBMAG49_13800 [Planctomycetota bacterium]